MWNFCWVRTAYYVGVIKDESYLQYNVYGFLIRLVLATRMALGLQLHLHM